jgi:hypothetical protein
LEQLLSASASAIVGSSGFVAITDNSSNQVAVFAVQPQASADASASTAPGPLLLRWHAWPPSALQELVGEEPLKLHGISASLILASTPSMTMLLLEHNRTAIHNIQPLRIPAASFPGQAAYALSDTIAAVGAPDQQQGTVTLYGKARSAWTVRTLTPPVPGLAAFGASLALADSLLVVFSRMAPPTANRTFTAPAGAPLASSPTAAAATSVASRAETNEAPPGAGLLHVYRLQDGQASFLRSFPVDAYPGPAPHLLLLGNTVVLTAVAPMSGYRTFFNIDQPLHSGTEAHELVGLSAAHCTPINASALLCLETYSRFLRWDVSSLDRERRRWGYTVLATLEEETGARGLIWADPWVVSLAGSGKASAFRWQDSCILKLLSPGVRGITRVPNPTLPAGPTTTAVHTPSVLSASQTQDPGPTAASLPPSTAGKGGADAAYAGRQGHIGAVHTLAAVVGVLVGALMLLLLFVRQRQRQFTRNMASWVFLVSGMAAGAQKAVMWGEGGGALGGFPFRPFACR